LKRYPDYQSFRKDLLSGKVSCISQVEYHLDKIHANESLNAFLSVYESEALNQARIVDEKIMHGTAGRLAGLVVGLKDVLCYQNHPLQAGSKILNDFKSQFNATAVQRLVDEDAIIIGRQNCDEFAMGSSNENSAFGPVKNPLDYTRVPGGSSGGSAAAVAADLCMVSIGSDTGGSVRQPAAFCGIVGVKPTYSRISRYGLVAYGSSFDCIGIFSHTIEDSALVLEIISGADDYDSTVSKTPVPAYGNLLPKLIEKKFRIAVLDDIDQTALQPEIRDCLNQKIQQLEAVGHTINKVTFDLNEFVLPTYYILTTAEASSNLSRYDGVRYGHRSQAVTNLESLYKKSRTEGFGSEVQRRILLGNFVLTSDYYDAYYAKAQKVRRMIREKIREIFQNNDLILMPTAPTTAFKIGQHTTNPVEMYLADLFSVQANVAGIPAISVPCGKDHLGLPIGLQFMADDFRETELLAGAQALMNLA
jgi:aspartyl-tRNA(Asn)/glutamyl-tRNA(Gln) amidotransferase subunit A